MVKRFSGYLLLTIFLLLALSAVGWLFFTPAGVEAVLRAVSRFSPVSIEAAAVEGRLAGTVRLIDVRVQSPAGDGRAKTLSFHWRPLPLLRGALGVDRLQLQAGEVLLHDNGDKATAAPGDFTFPEVSGMPLRLQAEVGQLEVDDFTIRKGEREVVRVQRLHGGVAWNAGVLELKRLDFIGSPGRITGAGTADFVKPALQLKVQFAPAGGNAVETIGIRTDLQPAAGRRQLTGSFAVAVDGQTRLQLQSTADWRPDRIALTEIYLTRPGATGEIRGEMGVSAAENFPFDLSLHLAAIDLQAETGTPTALFGRLTAEGDRRGWTGKFSLENRVDGWQRGELTGTFAGDPHGLTLADLKGVWLQGSIQGRLAAAWTAGWQIEATLAGSNLQPAVVVPEWPGRINFALQGRVHGGEGTVPVGRIDGALHDSTLRGRALTGSIVASLQGEDVRIDKLDLRGDVFTLHASGRLQERIDYRANIARLAGLVPGAEGAVRARGWVRRQAGALFGELALTATEVAWRELRLGQGVIDVSKQKDGAFSIAGDLARVAWREYRLATAALQANGTLPAHRLRLTTTGADLQLHLDARGGYAEQGWQGELLALRSAGRLTGRWLLREPTALFLAADRVRVAPLQLAGDAGELVTAASDLAFSPMRGWIDAQWQQLNLARGNPWLAEVALSGHSSGSGRIEWLSDERLDLRGELSASGTVLRADQRLQVRRAAARIAWSPTGLRAAAEAELADLGTFSLTAESPDAATAAWPLEGSFAARWRLPDLAPLSPWLPGMAIAGSSAGTVNGRWWDGGGIEVAGKVEMRGQIRREALRLDIRQAQTVFSWGIAGLQANWKFDLGEQGRFAGAISSAAPAELRIPDTGELQAEWEGIDLAVLRPWLPENIVMLGSVTGETSGEWSPGQRLRLVGGARLVNGEMRWQNEEGIVAAGVQEGTLNWDWQEESLAAEMRLQLAGLGRAEGSFRLPIPARWPLAVESTGAVQGRMRADLQEDGLLNAVFPGVVQESRGKLTIDLRVGGTWQTPDFGGAIRLREAAAYLPAAGIRLQDVELAGKLAGQDFEIDSLQMSSGGGRIVGEGRITLKQWRIAAYQINLRGEKFRAVHLPELQLRIDPDLRLAGTPEQLTVRGDLRIPEMLIAGRKTAAPVKPSGDVVIVDAPPASGRNLQMALDVRVRLLLGDHVLVDTEGIDARLEGGVLLLMTGLEPDEITAQGEIRVAQGKYATYGVSLDITRGKLLFAGGPVTKPTLDIRAMRTVGEVAAGVKVSGTPAAPRVELVSEPAMADTDILAYIVLGHPIGQEGGANAGLLMLAANNLLSKGDSAVLQDRLKRTLGLDVLEIDTGNGDARGSQITIGKYLNPDLYISFGQSLFNNMNEIRMRYNLSKRWQLESSLGEPSAVDLYYKIEFR